MKLGLGTVQFGMDYGLSNSKGQVLPSEAKKILQIAVDHGIDLLDTAHTYGNSEVVLGEANQSESFQIVTKTPLFKGEIITTEDAFWLRKVFDDSLIKLQCESLYGLLVHHSEDLLRPNGELLLSEMKALQAEGKVGKIGVSAYSSDDVERVLKMFTPDIIQLPLNVFDQQKVHNGTLQRLKDAGVEVHVRSVFLQGLLLMSPEQSPHHFDSIKDHLERYNSFLNSHSLTRLQGALKFVLQQATVDRVVLGVCSSSQLLELIEAIKKLPDEYLDMAEFALLNEKFINPLMWKK